MTVGLDQNTFQVHRLVPLFIDAVLHKPVQLNNDNFAMLRTELPECLNCTK